MDWADDEREVIEQAEQLGVTVHIGDLWRTPDGTLTIRGADSASAWLNDLSRGLDTRRL